MTPQEIDDELANQLLDNALSLRELSWLGTPISMLKRTQLVPPASHPPLPEPIMSSRSLG